MIYTRIIR